MKFKFVASAAAVLFGLIQIPGFLSELPDHLKNVPIALAKTCAMAGLCGEQAIARTDPQSPQTPQPSQRLQAKPVETQVAIVTLGAAHRFANPWGAERRKAKITLERLKTAFPHLLDAPSSERRKPSTRENYELVQVVLEMKSEQDALSLCESINIRRDEAFGYCVRGVLNKQTKDVSEIQAAQLPPS